MWNPDIHNAESFSEASSTMCSFFLFLFLFSELLVIGFVNKKKKEKENATVNREIECV